MTTTPTLDPERTTHLRTFLTVEAAADVARTDAAANHRLPARRLALGVLATAVVAASLLVGGTVLDSSTGGGRRAEALSIERQDGWTTIRIADIDADPDAVLGALRAAGFAARHEQLHVERSGPDGQQVTIGEGANQAGLSLAASGEPGGHGLAGLTVEYPDGDAPLLSAPAPAAGPPADDGGDVRFELDGAVSIRNGTNVTVVVLTER